MSFSVFCLQGSLLSMVQLCLLSLLIGTWLNSRQLVFSYLWLLPTQPYFNFYLHSGPPMKSVCNFYSASASTSLLFSSLVIHQPNLCEDKPLWLVHQSLHPFCPWPCCFETICQVNLLLGFQKEYNLIFLCFGNFSLKTQCGP